MAAIFGLVDRARSNAAHAQTGISGHRQGGNYTTYILHHKADLDRRIKKVFPCNAVWIG